MLKGVISFSKKRTICRISKCEHTPPYIKPMLDFKRHEAFRTLQVPQQIALQQAVLLGVAIGQFVFGMYLALDWRFQVKV